MILLITWLLSSAILGVSMEDTKQADLSADRLFFFASPNSSESIIIDQYYNDIARLSRFYNYDIEKVPYFFQPFRFPLITKSLLLKGEGFESMTPSRFLVIVHRDTKGLNLVPWDHGGVRTFGDPYRDPHNWAYFSDVIEKENLEMDTDLKWLQLAVCYMGMVGELPHLLTKANSKEIEEINGAASGDFFPRVDRLKTTVRVVFLNIEDSEKRTFSGWRFECDLNGKLKYVDKEKLTRLDLLKKTQY
jgi:hypothetical protein